jgi:ABC-type glycerol-3-phosphate transport system substrate-binding protein
MKISLFQGIFVGAFVLAALVGLFVFATYTSTGGEGKVGTVVIWGTLPEDDFKVGLLEATKSDNTLRGVNYIEKSAGTLPGDLATAIATGKSPDLVLASQEELVSLAPYIAPIPFSTLSVSAFSNAFANEGALFTAPLEAGYYGIPLLIDPLVLFYNRAILESGGIVSPPATWEALTGLVSHVATYTTTRQITRGLIALGTYDNVHDARGILSALFLQTGAALSTRSPATGEISPELGLTSREEDGLPPGQAVLRFYTQFADSSKVSYTWNASLRDSQMAFSAGDLGLYLGYVSEARFLRESSPNLDFDVAPLPQPGTATTKSTYGLAYALMIPTGAKNARGAYKAAVLLADTPEQLALAKATGLAPAAKDALEAPTPSDPVATLAARSALYADGWLSPAPAGTDEVFGAMITDVITGRTNLQTALSTAERSLGALFER